MSTTSASLTPWINGSIEPDTYHSKSFSSLWTNFSQLFNQSTPSFSSSQIYPVGVTLRIKCTAIGHNNFLSMLFDSSVFHFRISVPYLSTDAAHVLIANITFLTFDFDFKTISTSFYIHLQTFLSSPFLWSYPFPQYSDICILFYHFLLSFVHAKVQDHLALELSLCLILALHTCLHTQNLTLKKSTNSLKKCMFCKY